MTKWFLVEVPMQGRWYKLDQESPLHYRIVYDNAGDIYDPEKHKMIETRLGTIRTPEQVAMLIFLHGGIEQFPNFETLLGINGGPLPNPYTFGDLDVTMQQRTQTDTLT